MAIRCSIKRVSQALSKRRCNKPQDWSAAQTGSATEDQE